jgi:polyphosphate kinase 2
MGHKKDKAEHKSNSKQQEENSLKSIEEITQYKETGKIANKYYLQELQKLQYQLVVWQYWIKQKGKRVAILFEGRDAAGKGGIIKRITEPLNPRGLRVVALDKPNDREHTQWYFQRYVSHLPSAGEIVIFDRSWYNRAGVERVMGFCNEDEYQEFLRSCPEFEKMLVRSGIHLIKYWISVNDEEQERRLKDRAADPSRRWKLSPMDLQSWDKWVEYSKAKDEMMRFTDTKQVPWYNVDANDKKKARLNAISHLLSLLPYEDTIPQPFEMPKRKIVEAYKRPPIDEVTWVPESY